MEDKQNVCPKCTLSYPEGAAHDCIGSLLLILSKTLKKQRKFEDQLSFYIKQYQRLNNQYCNLRDFVLETKEFHDIFNNYQNIKEKSYNARDELNWINQRYEVLQKQLNEERQMKQMQQNLPNFNYQGVFQQPYNQYNQYANQQYNYQPGYQQEQFQLQLPILNQLVNQLNLGFSQSAANQPTGNQSSQPIIQQEIQPLTKSQSNSEQQQTQSRKLDYLRQKLNSGIKKHNITSQNEIISKVKSYLTSQKCTDRFRAFTLSQYSQIKNETAQMEELQKLEKIVKANDYFGSIFVDEKINNKITALWIIQDDQNQVNMLGNLQNDYYIQELNTVVIGTEMDKYWSNKPHYKNFRFLFDY